MRSKDSVSGSVAYSYDSLSRLTEVCYAVDKCSDDATDYLRYAYDGAGNRTWENRPNGSTWSLYGAGSELLASITAPKEYPRGPPSARSYSYDADGNLTSDGTTEYTWNAAGKPTSSTTAMKTATYTHTGEGRRANSTSGSRTTAYLWDALSPQILQTASGKTSQRYSYGAGLIAQSSAGGTGELLSGRAGSLVTAAGKSLSHYDYEPYGAPRQTTGAAQKLAGPTYAGALQLPDGNYLMGQREYNPTTATFLSPDQGDSSQPYAYAAGNPISNNDLQGLSDIEGTLTDVSTVSGWTSTAALAADITVGAVASRFPALGRARARSMTQAARVGPDSARNSASRDGLSRELSRAEGRSVFTESGYLRAEVIDESSPIIPANELGNARLKKALISDGSDIADWAKYSTKACGSPQGPFQVHFYYNPRIERVYYDADYQVKFN